MTREYEQLNSDPSLLEGLAGPDPAPGADVLLKSGEPLSCLVCRAQRFTRREIKLNTTGMTLMDLDWANRSGDGAICRACGYVHVFLDGELTWRSWGLRRESAWVVWALPPRLGSQLKRG